MNEATNEKGVLLLNNNNTPLTKKLCKEIATSTYEKLEIEGESATTLLIQSKFLELYAKELRGKVIKMAIDEVSETGEKGTLTELGVKLEVCESGVKYDYSSDSEWCRLNQAFEEAKKALKERESFLKGIPQPKLKGGTLGVFVDEETGEIIDPPVRSSTTTVKVSFPSGYIKRK